MATLAELKLASRQKANQEYSTFVSDTELKDYINQSFAELYDILVSRFEDYFSKVLEFTITSGNSYSLPSDLYKIRGLDFKLNTDDFVTVRKFNFEDRNKISRNTTRSIRGYSDRIYRVMGENINILPTDAAPGTYKLWYIPRYTPLVNDADVLTGVLDFQEYITVDAAMKMMIKEESDISALMAQKQALVARIEAMASNRDLQPDRISDVRNDWYNDVLMPRW